MGTAIGLLWMLLANAGVFLAALSLQRRVRTGKPAIDVLVLGLFRLLLVSLLVLGAGLTHSLRPWVLGLLGSLGVALFFASGAPRSPVRTAWPQLGWGYWAILAVVAFRLLLQVWFFSPHLGDALSYHLPKIAEWIRAEGFTREMGAHAHVTFPAGFELLETWWVVFLHHDVLIELAGVELLALGFLGVYAMARELALPSKAAFLGALVYATSPGIHLQATSGLNDGAVAALVIVTAALVAARVDPALLLVAVGLGTGMKGTYVYALPGLALLYAWARKWPDPGPASRVETRETLRRPGWRFLASGLALGVGAFWYLRNLAWFGNAFYPLGSPGFHDPTPVQLGPSVASLAANLGDLLTSRVDDHAGAYGPSLDFMAGWGPVAYSVGALGLVRSCRDRASFRKWTAAFLVSLASALLMSLNDAWCMRFVLFFPALLAVAAARLAEESRLLRALVFVGIAYQFGATAFSYDLSRGDAEVLARQPWRTRSAAALSKLSLPDGPIGYFGGYPGEAYLLYGPDYDRRVVYLRSGSSEALMKEMRDACVHTLYTAPSTEDQHRILKDALLSGRLLPAGGRIYRLR